MNKNSRAFSTLEGHPVKPRSHLYPVHDQITVISRYVSALYRMEVLYVSGESVASYIRGALVLFSFEIERSWLLWHRFAIHAVFPLLAACASNFLVLATPALDLELRAPAKDTCPESWPLKDIMGVHQPRELAKRFMTKTDRRVLDIGINKDVADRLSMNSSFPYWFEYYYDFV